MPEHDCLPPDISATDFVAHLARMSGLPPAAARERTAEVLRHVGLYEERYRPIGGYSTGMKQRVKLAQALVHDPRLLLLDEPTNGLDPAGRDDMLELVRRIGTEFGIAVIVASHLLGEIERVCDYLVAIEAGKLLQRCAARQRSPSRPGCLRSRSKRAARPSPPSSPGEASRPASTAAPSSWSRRVGPTRVRTTSCATRSSTSACRSSGSSIAATRSRICSGIGRMTIARPMTGRPWWRRDGVVARRVRGPAPDDRLLGHRQHLDLGYRGYEGPRLGRRHAIYALFVYSLRSAYGFGRSGRAKIVPIGLAILAALPAVLSIGVRAFATQAGAGSEFEGIDPIRYDSYYGYISTIVMLFVAAQAPELLGRDQRHHVLSLYFSRALLRIDYALAKFAALVAAILILVLIPQAVIFVGLVVSNADIVAALGANIGSIPPVLAGR